MHRRITIATKRLARHNPRFRHALARELRGSMRRTAAGESLQTVLEGGLKDFAVAVAKHLEKEFSEFLKFGQPFEAGAFNAGVSAEFKSDVGDEGETIDPVTADIGVNALWDRLDKMPKISVWATATGSRPFTWDVFFDWDKSPEAVVKNLGPAFARQLDQWFAGLY